MQVITGQWSSPLTGLNKQVLVGERVTHCQKVQCALAGLCAYNDLITIYNMLYTT